MALTSPKWRSQPRGGVHLLYIAFTGAGPADNALAIGQVAAVPSTPGKDWTTRPASTPAARCPQYVRQDADVGTDTGGAVTVPQYARRNGARPAVRRRSGGRPPVRRVGRRWPSPVRWSGPLSPVRQAGRHPRRRRRPPGPLSPTSSRTVDHARRRLAAAGCHQYVGQDEGPPGRVRDGPRQRQSGAPAHQLSGLTRYFCLKGSGASAGPAARGPYRSAHSPRRRRRGVTARPAAPRWRPGSPRRAQTAP